MNGFGKAILGGAIGSLTTNLAHELGRRAVRDAPRVDLLGMQALSKALTAVGLNPPIGQALYGLTLAADLVTNAGYFAFAALVPPRFYVSAGTLVGVAAGIGAVTLPAQIGLTSTPTNRTAGTQAMSIALYTLGGIATGLALRALRSSDDAEATYFAGKHVAITGGSRGLGFGLSRRLLDAGARVTICGRSADSLAAAVQRLDSSATRIAGFVCDVRAPDDCERFIALAVERHGPIDVLINNAGVIEVGPAAEQTPADYREAMDTHFWGPLQTTLAVLPGMKARHCGHVVNIASIGGVVGVPHLAPYSASKFAQIGLTQALGAELAAFGVKLTSIVPGLMITGSPEHAIFKGRYRAEYAWFTLSDANPLLSVTVEAAVTRILQAITRGEAQAVIGVTAKIAKTVNMLFPETTARLLRLAAGLLPQAGGIGQERTTGAQSHSAWTQNPLTQLNTNAAAQNNQLPPLSATDTPS